MELHSGNVHIGKIGKKIENNDHKNYYGYLMIEQMY